MNILSLIANYERRTGPIILQISLVMITSIAISFLPYNNLFMFIITPIAIGWYFNGNEVHRLIFIPLWIIITWGIGAAIY